MNDVVAILWALFIWIVWMTAGITVGLVWTLWWLWRPELEWLWMVITGQMAKNEN